MCISAHCIVKQMYTSKHIIQGKCHGFTSLVPCAIGCFNNVEDRRERSTWNQFVCTEDVIDA